MMQLPERFLNGEELWLRRVISGSMALSVPQVWEGMWDDVVPRNKRLFHQ